MIEDHLGDLIRRFGFKSGIAKIPNQMATPVDDDPTRLNLGTAVEIRHGEYQVARDGTLVVDGKRTFIYICNPSNFRGKLSLDDISSLPKYHFTECTTISSMAAKGRADRYVRPIIPDGKFRLLLVNNDKKQTVDTPLYPCGYCLKALFPEIPFSKRESFTVQHFFKKYPLECKDEFITSRKSVLQANHNTYSESFKQLSKELRSKKLCEGCNERFEEKELDTHHLNGDASNNTPLNLKVLCIDCHIKEPNHSHYRSVLEKNGRLDRFYEKYPKKKNSHRLFEE
jgi:hypothetical protein